MSLSKLCLTVWVFLLSAGYLNWFTVKPKVIAWVGLVFVALVLLEWLGILSFSLAHPSMPARKAPPAAE